MELKKFGFDHYHTDMAFNLPARPGSLDTPISVPITSIQPSSSPVTGPLSPAVNLYNRFWAWRKALDLPNPGTVENLTKEVKCEFNQS